MPPMSATAPLVTVIHPTGSGISRRGASVSSKGEACTAQRPAHLLLEHLFNLADFLLDFACEVFGLAFSL
jgi:hypothetical protein